jgi:acyl-CoA synthetase (NDP forming)
LIIRIVRPTLAQFLSARHICVVGATESSFAGTATQRNLRHHGFTGRISQVHPRNRIVDGASCVASLSDLDDAPDIAVLLAPARALPQVLQEAEAVGTGWAVIPGAGEADAGPQAVVVAEFLRDPARTIRVVGPNCMGIVAPPEQLTAYIGTVPASVRPGSVAMLSQSGAVIEAFISQGPRIGYRMLASTGNELHLTSEDVIEFLLDEGRTDVVLLSQEGVSDPARYFTLLGRAAAAGVRVGIVRVGRSPISQAAALTHTGAITGDWDLWARLARRQGAVVLDSLDELHEFGALAQSSRRPVSSRTWIVTNSGGQGSQIADVLASATHIVLPPPTTTHLAAFAEVFPNAGEPSNPMDLWGLARWQDAYQAGFRLISEHGGGGTLIAAVDGSPDQGVFEAELAAGIVRLASGAVADDDSWRVVHLAPLAAAAHTALAGALAETGCPSVRGAAGLRALAALLAPTGPALDADQISCMGRWETSGRRLSHDDALAAMTRFGVPVPRTVIAASVAAAARAAGSFRGPLVVKAVGPAHRAKVGGVALGVAAGDVPIICERMSRIDGCVGFEIVEQVSADMELLVHAATDQQLGPRVTLGVGGALTEQAALAVCDVAPRSRDEAARLLRRTVGGQIDDDAATGWVDAVCQVIVALGGALAAGDVVEVEINPLAVDRLGARAVAVDVLARGGTR